MSVSDMLLPAYCVLCGLYCGRGTVCPPCQAELPRITAACRQCALPCPQSEAMLCGACIQRSPLWDRALAALLYEFPVDRVVQLFKFRRNMTCGQLLADELARCVGQAGAPYPEILIPVPLHLTRRLCRGFNQAEFLARELGKRHKLPVLTNRLRRKRRTAAQSGLNRIQRRLNVRGAFQCQKLEISRVALVDDVLTSGTTLAACTAAVRAAGAQHVAVWVAARTGSGQMPT